MTLNKAFPRLSKLPIKRTGLLRASQPDKLQVLRRIVTVGKQRVSSAAHRGWTRLGHLQCGNESKKQPGKRSLKTNVYIYIYIYAYAYQNPSYLPPISPLQVACQRSRMQLAQEEGPPDGT